jgi:uncharacterized repeat protein (TIGR03803 family)
MNPRIVFRHRSTPLLASFLLAAATAPALAQTWPPAPFSETTLYSFTGGADGDSAEYVTLSTDSTGALYGTTLIGGGGGGAVFKLTPPAPGKSQWTGTVLYSFTGSANNGLNPNSGLAKDYGGAFYGVTLAGGATGIGTAFKLTPPVPPSTQWSFAQIYDFTQSTGANPSSAPTFDSAGALIGAALYGGANDAGTIYKLTPPASSSGQWTGAALYNFTGGADGLRSASTLVFGADGAIYGTALAGGAGNNGLVFKLTPPGANCTPVSPNLWCETLLHAFNGGDGSHPMAGLVIDSASGVLYGTTLVGGANNLGVVFSLTPPVPPSTQWVETVLHSFAGGQDGANPQSPLTLTGGSLYGATTAGGGTGCSQVGGCGTLFQLTPPAAPTFRWTENVLYRFSGAPDGAAPLGGLKFNAFGFGSGLAIYGVANAGGASGKGTVFTLQCAKATREVFGGALHTACAQ